MKNRVKIISFVLSICLVLAPIATYSIYGGESEEPVTEEVTEAITEPVTESETEPETEPVTEPVTEPETEPVTEPVTEPETEPVTEPVTEPETEPVTEPEIETESLTEPEIETESETEGDADEIDFSVLYGTSLYEALIYTRGEDANAFYSALLTLSDMQLDSLVEILPANELEAIITTARPYDFKYLYGTSLTAKLSQSSESDIMVGGAYYTLTVRQLDSILPASTASMNDAGLAIYLNGLFYNLTYNARADYAARIALVVDGQSERIQTISSDYWYRDASAAFIPSDFATPTVEEETTAEETTAEETTTEETTAVETTAEETTAEETTNEEETEPEEEVKLYYEVISASADGKNVTIRGYMPNGSSVRLSRLSDEAAAAIIDALGLDSTAIFAYDITIVDSNGKVWQPDELDVNVAISNLEIAADEAVDLVHVLNSEEEIKNALASNSAISAEIDTSVSDGHIDSAVEAARNVTGETGSIIAETANSDQSGTVNVVGDGTITINTDGFSIYVVASETEQTTYGTKISNGGAYGVELDDLVAYFYSDEGRSNNNHNWSSSNSSVATVEPNGKNCTVNLVSAGKTVITHSYTSKQYSITETFTLTVKDGYAYIFDENGGSTAAPDSITGLETGDTVVLPDYSGTKRGYTFIGWATVKNIIARVYHRVYSVGEVVTVENSPLTFYAVWSSSVDGDFYIRKDGTIPYEPSQYANSLYTRGIHISGVVKETRWVCDTTGVNVVKNLTRVPTTAEIKVVLPDYDETTEYIVWYVIKYADADYPNGTWHIDGVRLTKDKVNLSYDGNSSDGDVDNIPLGSQFAVDSTVYVGRDGGNNGSSTTPTRPGYEFNGWNTKADGIGTQYANEDTFTITEDTVLYAQWIPSDKTAYKVEWYVIGSETAFKTVTRYGTTGKTAAVTAADKQLGGRIYAGDDYEYNVLSGEILADGSLVLKLYFEATIDTAVTIKAGSAERMYNGAALTQADATATTVEGLPTGYSCTATTEGSQTDFGKSGNVIKSYTIYDADKNDVTSLFSNVTKTDGELSITKRTVMLTSADDEKVYDGDPLINDTITVTGDGWVSGEGADYDVKGSQLDPGSSENTFEYTLTANTKADNYIISKVEGTLTVTKVTKVITITADSDRKFYDGTALTDDGYTYTENILAQGDVLEAVIEGEQTEKGVGDNTVKSYKVVRTSDNKDVTENYTFGESVNGTLTVVAGELTITKTVDKLIAGQSFIFKITGGGNTFFEVMNASDFNGKTATKRITNLSEGSYTVQEDTIWSWRYSCTSGGTQTVTLTLDDYDGNSDYIVKAGVEFVNAMTHIYRISGETYAVNRWSVKTGFVKHSMENM